MSSFEHFQIPIVFLSLLLPHGLIIYAGEMLDGRSNRFKKCLAWYLANHLHLTPQSLALIHSILFLRHFGLVRPLEVEIFNIVYVAIDDSTIEQTVEEKIRQAVQVLEQQGQQQQLITIGFMEKRPTKQGWFIGAQKRFELACWEQWTLAVTVAEEANTEMALKAALGRIFQLADAKIDHIPPITAELASEFLYQISVPSIIATSINNSNGASTSATTTGTSNNNNMNDASYMSLLRRMLTDAAPPLLMG